MRKILSLLAAMPLVFVLACGGAAEEPAADVEEEAEPAAAAVDLTDAGGVVGVVSFEGDAPDGQPIAMDADPYCLGAHEETVMSQPVEVGSEGGLGHVFVYVADGLAGTGFPGPEGNALLNQSGCLYDPHVLAVQAEQTIVIRNSDDTLHNINVQPNDNPAFNISQPFQDMEMERSFPNAEVGIPVRCDVHPWMNAFISVYAHHAFGTTDADGNFSIDRLPPGDYVLEAWHETLGTQTQSVTVPANETAEVGFVFGG